MTSSPFVGMIIAKAPNCWSQIVGLSVLYFRKPVFATRPSIGNSKQYQIDLKHAQCIVLHISSKQMNIEFWYWTD